MKKRNNSLFNRVFMVLVFLFLYAPIVLLIIFSFNDGNSNMVWKGFSLRWYEKLFSDQLVMESLYKTLLVSLLATVIATIAGTFAAIGFYAMRRRMRNPLMTVNNIPMMNADIVTGVSMCLLFVAFFNLWGDFARWFNGVQSLIQLPVRLTLGFGTLLIAHITFNIPYVILSVSPKLRQMDKNLVDAAQDLGCTWMQAFWKVIIPEIKPGIISGALTAFTMSIDDFIISYFTAGTSASTLAMTRSILKTWPPYTIKYPSPARETRNSPAMTPTSDRPMLTFSESNRVGTLYGSTILQKIWLWVAPKVRAMRMAPGSVSRKPLSISSTVTTSEIAIAIKTMARVPAPARMMITGPRAIFGRLLSTTRYGSLTRDTNGLHHSRIASSTPAAAPSRKPASVSPTVTQMW